MATLTDAMDTDEGASNIATPNESTRKCYFYFFKCCHTINWLPFIQCMMKKKLDPKQVFKPILYILFEHRRKADAHLYKHGILWNGFYTAKWKT